MLLIKFECTHSFIKRKESGWFTISFLNTIKLFFLLLLYALVKDSTTNIRIAKTGTIVYANNFFIIVFFIISEKFDLAY